MKTSDKQSRLNMRNKDVLFALVLILASVSLIVYSLNLSIKAMKTVKATSIGYVIISGLCTLISHVVFGYFVKIPLP